MTTTPTTTPTTETYYQLNGSYPSQQWSPSREEAWEEYITSLGLTPSWGSGMGLGLRDIDWEFDNREAAIKVFEYLMSQNITWQTLNLTGYTVEIINTYTDPTITPKE